MNDDASVSRRKVGAHFLLLLATLLVVSGSFLVVRTLIWPDPKARLDVPKLLEVGELKPNSEKTIVAELRNPCSLPIDILQVHTGCTCALVRVDERTILPGEATQLAVTLLAGDGTKFRSDLVITFHFKGRSSVSSHRISLVGTIAE